ncbi:kinase-like domain-containing protein [Pilobolus umbonatus]|nr:kinase-like domain-containing protein [Pilobolus umbonatus]
MHHHTSNNTEPPTNKSPKVNNYDTALNGIGPYAFIRVLGRGKFSKVVLAYHLETMKRVAIKIIDKQSHDDRVMSRLVREISILEILQHDSIIQLHETYESCDSLFLIMEYIAGWNLDEYLQTKDSNALSETEARYLFRQIVTAVDYCHRNWIVHRDLKTPNILISLDGQVKLADFGLGNYYGLQRLKTICGSMLYYSPEIITGQKYYGPEIDCWCLGITLFRMTAGFDPFSHALTVEELRRDICKANFPMPDHLSPELQATIRKCLQVDRRKRITLADILKDDPWLTNSGNYDCILSNPSKSAYDDCILNRENQQKETARHFIHRMKRESQLVHKLKKTLIYHPVNPSTYYTATVAGQYQSTESLRLGLLQTIRAKTKRLGITSVERWNSLRSPGIKSILSSLQLKSKKKDAANRSFVEMVQSITKDQVHHFRLKQPSRPPSLSSSSSNSSVYSNDSAFAAMETDDISKEKKYMGEVMSLLKQTCQLMGITYIQVSSTSLRCVLALRTDEQSATPSSSMSHQTRNIHKQSHSSFAVGDEGKMKRLSLPLFSQLTSNLTTSLFNKKHSYSVDENANLCNVNNRKPYKSKKEKEKMALFNIHVITNTRNQDKISLRFSREKGSSTVFKMASGWVAGVLSIEDKRST